MPRMAKPFLALVALATLIASGISGAPASLAAAQQPPASPAKQPSTAAKQQPKGDPKDTEVWEPVPPVVTPGSVDGAPPSDAIVLFDGKNLNEWVSAKDKSPAKWIVADGVVTVDKKAGNIETKRSFKD